MRENGPFTMGLQTKNEQAEAALKLLGETLRDYINKGPTAEELKRSKQNITGGWALRVDSNKKITEYVAMIGFYGLPLDYLDTFTGKVEAVSIADIKDAFKRRIQPDKLVTVMVGGKK
jgi:zinc protease